MFPKSFPIMVLDDVATLGLRCTMLDDITEAIVLVGADEARARLRYNLDRVFALNSYRAATNGSDAPTHYGDIAEACGYKGRAGVSWAVKRGAADDVAKISRVLGVPWRELLERPT